MPRPTIEYLNARRECRPAGTGLKPIKARNAADDNAKGHDAAELAQAVISNFALWAELSRQQLMTRILPPIGEVCDDMPF